MSYTLTNPIFTTKVVAYERLAYNPKVWFKEYELFPDKYSLDEWMDCYKTIISKFLENLFLFKQNNRRSLCYD